MLTSTVASTEASAESTATLASVQVVLRPEAGVERALFVQHHEHMDSNGDEDRIDKQGQRQEEPGLAQDHQKRRDIDGIVNPAVWPDGDESPRRVPRTGRATNVAKTHWHVAYNARPPNDWRDGGPDHRPRNGPAARIRISNGASTPPAPDTTSVDRTVRSARRFGDQSPGKRFRREFPGIARLARPGAT